MQSLQLTGRKALVTTIIIAGIIIFSLIVTFTIIFSGIQSELDSLKDHALSKAKEETTLKTVQSSYIYNSKSSYAVFTGEDDDGKLIHVFVPKQEELPVEWIDASEGLSKDEMTQKWLSSCTDCELMNMNLGIMNDRYIWEIIYEKNNRMYFQTYRFINGELYDSISFKQN